MTENLKETTGERISPRSIEREMKESYLTYALSVIHSRALPDVRDGLKPSQRRILVAMNDLNLGPRAKYRKCAKVAGDTSGNYHPHGEAVIYPTLVRQAARTLQCTQSIEGTRYLRADLRHGAWGELGGRVNAANSSANESYLWPPPPTHTHNTLEVWT